MSGSEVSCGRLNACAYALVKPLRRQLTRQLTDDTRQCLSGLHPSGHMALLFHIAVAYEKGCVHIAVAYAYAMPCLCEAYA